MPPRSLPRSLVWQFRLFLLRFFSVFAFLLVVVIQMIISPSPHPMRNILVLCFIGYFGLNDLILLVWDVYFYGSFISTVTFQTINSLVLIIVACVSLRLGPVVAALVPTAAFLASLLIVSSLILIIITIRPWYRRPKQIWKLGIKELAYNGTRSMNSSTGISIFGNRRASDDEVHQIWAQAVLFVFPMGFQAMRGFLQQIPLTMKLAFLRRTSDVETLAFALSRNITAIGLVLILTAQSVQLFRGVIYEKFGIQETWDDLGFEPGNSIPELYYEKDPSDPPWDIYWTAHDSEVSLSDLLQKKASPNLIDRPQDFNGSFYKSSNEWDGIKQVVNIAMVSRTATNSSGTGEMWLTLSDAWDLPDSTHIATLFQYGDPIKLIAGMNVFGVLDITQRRYIKPSFLDMMGFAPQYTPLSLISMRQTFTLPLGNNSIAQATLKWDRNLPGKKDGLPRQYKVITDYRRHTFIEALSSIGGLLATLQGLHVLFFGMPLWWGLFGSKLLNPFGIVGRSCSEDNRKQMVSRYGHIPSSPTVDGSGTRGLSLFLSDFVVNVGPLANRVLDEEQTIENGNTDPSGRNANDTEMQEEELDVEWNLASAEGSHSRIPLVPASGRQHFGFP